MEEELHVEQQVPQIAKEQQEVEGKEEGEEMETPEDIQEQPTHNIKISLSNKIK